MTSTSCSGSSISKSLNQHLDGASGPSNDHVASPHSYREHFQPDPLRKHEGTSENRWIEYTAGATQCELFASVNGASLPPITLPSSSHPTSQVTPSEQPLRDPLWRDEYDTFRSCSTSAMVTTIRSQKVITTRRFPQYTGLRPSYPGPGLSQLSPFAEAEFDDEMRRWMNQFGNDDNLSAASQLTQKPPSRSISEEPQELPNNPQESPAAPTVSVDHTDTTELSLAASELLKVVTHENSHKWVNSTFLALMQGLKNRDKDIVGSEIVSVEATIASTNFESY